MERERSNRDVPRHPSAVLDCSRDDEGGLAITLRVGEKAERRIIGLGYGHRFAHAPKKEAPRRALVMKQVAGKGRGLLKWGRQRLKREPAKRFRRDHARAA